MNYLCADNEGETGIQMIGREKELQQQLIAWFRKTRRDLPWRKTYEPYHVWLSEIMLQQTQMDRGVAYFLRWIERFPDIPAVAAAEEQEILKLWEGLGYYARARNLHKAARVLVEKFDGQLPCDVDLLLSLPGIGPYTAAAISSIACNTDVAVIDANVLRVYARLFDIDGTVKRGSGRRRIEVLATEMLPRGQARIYNQAIMDFGGLVCTPKNPTCEVCPLKRFCLALHHGTVDVRPVPEIGQKKILIEMATGMLVRDRKIFIQQRLADDIWGSLWEFPGGRLEKDELPETAVVREYLEETGYQVEVCAKITTVTHFYTRYKVVLHCFSCRLIGSQEGVALTAAQDYRWVSPDELDRFGFPAGHRKLLEYIAGDCPALLSDPCEGQW